MLAEHAEAVQPDPGAGAGRVAARLAAEHGAGGAGAGRDRAYAVLAELAGARPRSPAARRPSGRSRTARSGVYGRLRATRPGEYLLLDTTRLDVFAMEPVTLRWVQAELTVAMDLYSPVHHRAAADAGLDQGGGRRRGAVRGGPRARTRRQAGGALPYHGVPGPWSSSRQARRRDAAAAAAVGRGGDHRGRPRKIYLSDHLISACARLGISVQPARPYTPPTRPRWRGSSGPCARGCWPRCPATRARTSTAAARTGERGVLLPGRAGADHPGVGGRATTAGRTAGSSTRGCPGWR